MQESRTARTTGGSVVTHRARANDLPSYTVPDDGLEMGASLGNSAVWVTTKGTGAIDRIFSVAMGASLINAVCIRYAGPGHSALDGMPGEHASVTPAYTGLQQDAPGTFEIHPAYQRHHFSIADSVDVTGTVFLCHSGKPGGEHCTVGGNVVILVILPFQAEPQGQMPTWSRSLRGPRSSPGSVLPRRTGARSCAASPRGSAAIAQPWTLGGRWRGSRCKPRRR